MNKAKLLILVLKMTCILVTITNAQSWYKATDPNYGGSYIYNSGGNVKIQGSAWGPGKEVALQIGDWCQNLRAKYAFGLTIGTYQAQNAVVIRETTGRVGINTTEPVSKLEVNGSIGYKITKVPYNTSIYYIQEDDNVIIVETDNTILHLPIASTAKGRVYTIKLTCQKAFINPDDSNLDGWGGGEHVDVNNRRLGLAPSSIRSTYIGWNPMACN